MQAEDARLQALWGDVMFHAQPQIIQIIPNPDRRPSLVAII